MYVFFRLAERLRSLFTLFAGHIVSHAATMLDENNSFKTGILNKGIYILLYKLEI